MKFFLLVFTFCFFTFSGFSQYGNQCISGDCVNGHGILSYGPKVGRYEGEFKDGKREGFGTMFYADGRKWEGQWKKDAFKGGITSNIPYMKSDTLRKEGLSAGSPFIDALYRILSSAPDNFNTLKGVVTGKDFGYDMWQPKVLLPSSTRAYITAKTGECRYYFIEQAPLVMAEKMFADISKMVMLANPQTWKFDDLSYNPAFPYHKKLYKWTIATPTVIRLEMKQSTKNKALYDVYMVFTS